MKKAFLLFFNLFNIVFLFSIIHLQAMEEQFSEKYEDIPMAEIEKSVKCKEPKEKGVEEKPQPPLKRRKRFLTEQPAFIPLTEEEQEILTEEDKEKRFPNLTELTKRKIIESLPISENFPEALTSVTEELQEDIKKKAQEQQTFEETRLHRAQTSLEVKNLLALGVNPNIKDRSGRTALNALIDHGYLNAAFRLAALKRSDKKFDVSTTDKFGVSPLQRAIEHQDMELAELILSILEKQYKKTTIVDQITFFNAAGNSALFLAIRYNLLELVDKFMSFLDTYNLDHANERGLTPLVVAIIYNPAAIETLIKKGVNPNFIDKFNFTPLMVAARYNPAAIEPLIKNGSQPDYETIHGGNPLIIAAEYNPATIEPLIKNGAQPDYENREGETPLIVATKYNINSIEPLINNKANPNLINRDGYTALMIAALHHPEAIESLVKNHADPNFVNQNGYTALLVALQYKPESVELLLKNGANPNVILHTADNLGLPLNTTALELAIKKNQPENVKLLLNAGAHATEQALDLAKTKPEIDEILYQHLAKVHPEFFSE